MDYSNLIKYNINNLHTDLSSVYDLECHSVNELLYQNFFKMNSIIEALDLIVKDYDSKLENKTDLYGDHKGTWQGLNPTQANEFLAAQVEKNTEDLKNKQDKNLDYLNVLNFDIKNDKSESIILKFQELLNIAKNEGSVNIIVPAGEYLVDDKLTVYSNTHIKFLSGAKIIRSGGTDRFIEIGVDSEAQGYGAGARNIYFEGGEFYGDVENNLGLSISMHHVSNATFKNMNFTLCNYYGHCFDLSGSENILIDNCNFVGFKSISGREFTEAIQIDFSWSGTFSGILGGFDLLPTRDVTVQNCSFKPLYHLDTCGNKDIVYYAPNPIGAHSYGKYYYTNIKFINNVVENCLPLLTNETTGCWLRFYAVDGLYIRNNIFRNDHLISQTAISIQTKTAGYDEFGNVIESILPFKNVYIDNNIFEGFKDTDTLKRNSIILCYGRDFNDRLYHAETLNITNNTFKNCYPDNEYGDHTFGVENIYLYIIDKVNIKNNTFENIKRPIYIRDNCKNINIDNNNIYMAQFQILSVNDSENCLIQNNNISNSNGSIYILRVNNTSINNNNINNCFQRNISSDNKIIRVMGGKSTIVSNNMISNCDNINIISIMAFTSACDIVSVSNNIINSSLTTVIDEGTATNITLLNNIIIP